MWVISENDLAIFVFELLLFSLFEMCAYTFMFCTIRNRRLDGYKSNVLCTILLGIRLALTHMKHPIFWTPYTDGKQVI